ncbi:uncharacterized protein LOC110682689 [Chenopodium quinoa]|uniref:uncharacterized protein LOC110682689 n=1 Tax=Chenopodium quinoa TaxID=63459 RepID=UPI000B78939D|nr:uncharacterized protein LOC110682689 [Chenopodium quinoa]
MASTISEKELTNMQNRKALLLYLLDELQTDQWPVPPGSRALQCIGRALNVAAGLLGACSPGTSARIIALCYPFVSNSDINSFVRHVKLLFHMHVYAEIPCKILCYTLNNYESFCTQIFDLFDVQRKGVVDFGDFVRVLNVFHPNASQEDKIDFPFKLYDLDGTGYIERDEVRHMLIVILCESELKLADETIEQILYKATLTIMRRLFQLTLDGWLKTGDVCYFDEDGLWFSIDPLTEIC